jgi:hypothetical protein
MKNVRTKMIAVLAGVAVTGIASAAAAGLGGLDTGSVGAESDVIAACQTSGAIGIAFDTSYDNVSAEFLVDAVDLSAVDAACDGQTIDIVLTDSADDEIASGSGTLTVTAGAATVGLATSVAAVDVEGIAIVITG